MIKATITHTLGITNVCCIKRGEKTMNKKKKKHKIADTVVIYFSTVERVYHQTKITYGYVHEETLVNFLPTLSLCTTAQIPMQI